MIKKLTRKEEYFIESEDEALDFVDSRRDAEDGELIVNQNVQHKSNKNGDYFRVLLEYRYNTPSGIMETLDESEDEEDNESEGK